MQWSPLVTIHPQSKNSHIFNVTIKTTTNGFAIKIYHKWFLSTKFLSGSVSHMLQSALFCNRIFPIIPARFPPCTGQIIGFGWIWIPIQSKLGFANHANELETLSKTDIKTCKGQLPQINFEALLIQTWCYIPCTVVPFCSSTIVLSSTLHEACASFSHTHGSVEQVSNMKPQPTTQETA